MGSAESRRVGHLPAPRTAESHLQNILTKLGFTSRAQVAAYLAASRRDRP